jgi:hypothetical protein
MMTRKNLMPEQIVKYVELERETQQYTFKTYQSIVECLRAPFKTDMVGNSVTVSAADTAIMLKTSAIQIIKKHALGKKQRSANDNQNLRTKRQRPNGANQAVPMPNGTHAITSLHLTTGRHVCLSKVAWKKRKCGLDAEAKNISKALQALEKRKRQCTNGLEMRRKRQQQQQQQTNRQQEQQEQHERGGSEEEQEGLSENSPAEIMRIQPEAPLDQYWDV